MKSENKIGHNQPPKNELKNVDYLISRRVKIDTKKLRSMEPKFIRAADGAIKGYKAMQISDTEVHGFTAICTRPGHIHFHVRHAGKKYKVGTYLGTSQSITAARDLAEKLKTAIKLGEDPNTVRSENENKKTFGQVVQMFLKDKDALNNYKAGSSRENVKWRLNTYIMHNVKSANLRSFILKNRSALDVKKLIIDQVQKSDLMRFYNIVKQRGSRGVIANRCLEDFRSIFKYAIEKKLCKSSPATFSQEDDKLVTKRKRVEHIVPYDELEIVKLKKVFVAKYEDPRLISASRALHLILSVGARTKSEIFNLKWDDIKTYGQRTYLDLKDRKNGAKQLRLNNDAIAIIKEMRGFKEIKKHPLNIPMRDIKSKYVFPSFRSGRKPYVQDLRKSFRKLCSLAGVRILEIYMLKHTYWTNQDLPVEEMQELGGWKSPEAALAYKAFNKGKEDKILEKINKRNAEINRRIAI